MHHGRTQQAFFYKIYRKISHEKSHTKCVISMVVYMTGENKCLPDDSDVTESFLVRNHPLEKEMAIITKMLKLFFYIINVVKACLLKLSKILYKILNFIKINIKYI